MRGTERSGPGPDQDALEALFRHVPAREQPPDAHAAAIREAVHAEWRQAVRPRGFPGRRIAWAAAASIALAVLAWTQWKGGDRPAESAALATVKRSIGTSHVATGGPAHERALDVRSAISAGEAVVTQGTSRLALKWHNGIEVRMDANSRVELLSATALRLVDGRIYLDTLTAARGAVLEVHAPNGTIRHLGTQYQVRVRPGITELLVREGRIEFAGSEAVGSGRTVAMAGQRVSVTAGGEVAVGSVPVWGEAWNWAEAAGPAFDANGKTVAELLDWAARETGRTLSYRSPEVRRQASEVVMHGALDLSPADALAVATATTDFTVRLDGARIEVSMRE